MRKSILFWPDPFREHGHWMPTLKLAQDLYDCKSDEFSVSFMGIADCKPMINNYNNGDGQFPFYTLFPYLYPKGYSAGYVPKGNFRRKSWHVWAILYSQYENVEDVLKAGGKMPSAQLWEDAQSIRNAWKTANPDLLVHGYFASLEAILLYWIYRKTNVRFAVTTTFLHYPKNTPAIRAMVNSQVFSKPEKNKIINMATRGIISTDIPKMSEESFFAPLNDVKELILCPREFDFDYYEFEAQSCHIGPCIMKEFSQSALSFDSEGHEINWDEYLVKKNIIFVSAGSQVLDYEDGAKTLFHSVCKAMELPQFKDCFLIVTVGSKLVNSPEWQIYDKSRILIASWAPQRRILSEGNVKCSIIHGGLASIKECVYFNCPFVVNPLGKDQMENAVRLRRLGIDNAVYTGDLNASSLASIIDRVTSDSRMKEALQKLSDVFLAAENKKEGLRIIQEVLGH